MANCASCAAFFNSLLELVPHHAVNNVFDVAFRQMRKPRDHRGCAVSEYVLDFKQRRPVLRQEGCARVA